MIARVQPPARRAPRPHEVAFAAAALAFAAGAAWLLVASLGGAGAPVRVSQAAFVEQTGARVLLVALTGDGGLVDLRYQIVDAQKASGLHAPGRRPYVIDERSGGALRATWMDHAHRGELRPGVTYYQLLINKRGVLERGDRVTVVSGDARARHVLVR